MSWLTKLFVGDSPIRDVASGIGDVAKDLRTAFTGNEAMDNETRVKLEEIASRLTQGQVEINKIEAASDSLFKSGWRPFIGWVCGVSLASYYVPQYILAAFLWVRQCWDAQALVAYPVTADGLMELVIALLGMGVIRQVDKARR